MKYIKRDIEPEALKLIKGLPVLTITVMYLTDVDFMMIR
jgi:hypothetical protein